MYRGKHTKHEPSIAFELKHHRALLYSWKKANGKNFPCGEQNCNTPSSFSIFVIESAIFRRFFGTTCCTEHLQKCLEVHKHKLKTISKINL